MIQIYKPENMEYEKNGDMTLFPSEASVHPVLNGAWTAELTHPIDQEGRWKYIEEGAVVKMPSFNGDQCFRIIKKEKGDSGVTAEMQPIFMDAKNDCFLLDVRPTEKNGQEALDIMTASNKKYTGVSDIALISTAYYQTMNLIEAVNGDSDHAFVNRWGGEIIYDNYKIYINKRAGGDHGTEIRYGKNLSEDGLTEEIDMQDVITRIVPKAYNGYMIEGESPWVDSPLIDKYPTVRYAVMTFDNVKMREDAQEDDEENGVIVCDTQEELKTVLISQCEEQYEAGVDKPKVTIKANMVCLENTDLYCDVSELEKVSLGDDVHCRHSKLDIITDARVIEMEWDCIRKAVSSVVIGDFQYNYIENVESMLNRVENAIRSDGTVIGHQVQGVIDGVKAQMRVQSTAAKQSTVRAVLFEDLNPKSLTYGAMCLGTMGFEIASKRTADGRDWDWRTFGTGNGFFADYIVAGTMMANRIKGGTLTLGGKDNGNGVARVLDNDGNDIVRLDKDGVYAKGKYVCESISGLDMRVEICDGRIRFCNTEGKSGGYIEYAPEGIDIKDSEGVEVIAIRGKDLTFLTNSISVYGKTGQSGRAEFSDGTYLEFESGYLIGGSTKEGDF